MQPFSVGSRFPKSEKGRSPATGPSPSEILNLAEINARRAQKFLRCSGSPTTPAAPAHRHWCRGIAHWCGCDGGLCSDAQTRLRTEQWTRQSALIQQSSKSWSSFSSPIDPVAVRGVVSRACRAVLRGSKDGPRRLLLRTTSRNGEQIF